MNNYLRQVLDVIMRRGNIPDKWDDGRQPEIFGDGRSHHITFDEAPETGKVVNPTVSTYFQISEKKSYTPKLDLALEYLKANPNTTKGNREIARELGITHPTVAKAKEILNGNV